jgi:hypothetical protein
MARPTKYATLICLILTVLAVLGIWIGIVTRNPEDSGGVSSAIWPMIALLPAVGYEAYRTEGVSTRWASWGLVLVFIAELVLLIFKIDIDLVKALGTTERTVGGYTVPLGDIKVVGSALMIVLSVILFFRTRGVYTRWLAVIIAITSLAIVYILSPDVFPELLRKGIEQSNI